MTALASFLIDDGIVDEVIATQADPDNLLGNRSAAFDRRSIAATAGSRYQDSTPLAAAIEKLGDGRRYGFVGKPCDVSALRRLARHDPRVAESFPVLLSFFCAGVPSQRGAEALVARMGAKFSELSNFRYRGHGWPGRATAVMADGTETSLSYSESWGEVLSKHVQHRCKLCADGVGLEADLVAADAWDVDAAGYPLFDERPGVSLVLSRTELGAALLRRAEEADAIVTGAFDMARLEQMQPGQRNRKHAVLARLVALRVTGRRTPSSRNHQLGRAARAASIRTLLRNFLGMIRRSFRLPRDS